MATAAWKNCLACKELVLHKYFLISERGTSHIAHDHNFIYSYKLISECANCEAGTLEIYSHDCFGYHGDEPWDMYWYYLIPKDQMQQLKPHIATCKSPLVATSQCPFREKFTGAVSRLYGGIHSIEAPYHQMEYAILYITINSNGNIQLTTTHS